MKSVVAIATVGVGVLFSGCMSPEELAQYQKEQHAKELSKQVAMVSKVKQADVLQAIVYDIDSRFYPETRVAALKRISDPRKVLECALVNLRFEEDGGYNFTKYYGIVGELRRANDPVRMEGLKIIAGFSTEDNVEDLVEHLKDCKNRNRKIEMFGTFTLFGIVRNIEDALKGFGFKRVLCHSKKKDFVVAAQEEACYVCDALAALKDKSALVTYLKGAIDSTNGMTCDFHDSYGTFVYPFVRANPTDNDRDRFELEDSSNKLCEYIKQLTEDEIVELYEAMYDKKRWGRCDTYRALIRKQHAEELERRQNAQDDDLTKRRRARKASEVVRNKSAVKTDGLAEFGALNDSPYLSVLKLLEGMVKDPTKRHEIACHSFKNLSDHYRVRVYSGADVTLVNRREKAFEFEFFKDIDAKEGVEIVKKWLTDRGFDWREFGYVLATELAKCKGDDKLTAELLEMCLCAEKGDFSIGCWKGLLNGTVMKTVLCKGKNWALPIVQEADPDVRYDVLTSSSKLETKLMYELAKGLDPKKIDSKLLDCVKSDAKVSEMLTARLPMDSTKKEQMYEDEYRAIMDRGAAQKDKTLVIAGFYIGMPQGDAVRLAEHYKFGTVVVGDEGIIQIKENAHMSFCTTDKDTKKVTKINFTQKQLRKIFDYGAQTHEEWAAEFSMKNAIRLVPEQISRDGTGTYWRSNGRSYSESPVPYTVYQESWTHRNFKKGFRVTFFGNINCSLRTIEPWDRYYENPGAEVGALRIEAIAD